MPVLTPHIAAFVDVILLDFLYSLYISISKEMPTFTSDQHSLGQHTSSLILLGSHPRMQCPAVEVGMLEHNYLQDWFGSLHCLFIQQNVHVDILSSSVTIVYMCVVFSACLHMQEELPKDFIYSS